MSASSAALSFMRTYVLESGLSPTCSIFKLGLNLGFTFWVCFMSAWSLSLIFLAIAVPSIFVPTMTRELLEKFRVWERWAQAMVTRRSRLGRWLASVV